MTKQSFRCIYFREALSSPPQTFATRFILEMSRPMRFFPFAIQSTTNVKTVPR